MQKVLLTIFSILFFLASEAQIVTFRSLGHAISRKDLNGNFVKVREWIVQEVQINFDLSQKEVQFLSKGMFNNDTFSLKKKIVMLDETSSLKEDNDQMMKVFSGKDASGEKCIIKLITNSNKFKMHDGELQVEYSDRVEIYNLRAYRHNPTINEG